MNMNISNKPQYNNLKFQNNKFIRNTKINSNVNNVLIITSKYIVNFANEIKLYLSIYFSNIDVKVIDNTPLENQIIKDVINKQTYLIVIGVANIKKYDLLNHVSNNIAIIQTEQINILDKTFGGNKQTYIDFFNKFAYLYDYNLDNKQFLKNNTKIINPPINYYLYISETKDIDVLFIGTLNNRRDKIIKELNKKNIKITVISNSFGNELISHIKRSKVIINIHIDKESIFEIFRIHEILPYNTHIISETIKNHETINKYKDFVNFVPIINDNLDNINILENLIQIKLQNKYEKNPLLEKFIFKNNIEFYKELEYIARKIFNIKTNINVDPRLIDNSKEYKNILKINDTINSELKLLDHINQKISIFDTNANFEKDINKNLVIELDKAKNNLESNKSKKNKLELENISENDKLNKLHISINDINVKINNTQDKINNLKKEHLEIEKRESTIINKVNSISNNKNNKEKIVNDNQTTLNTLIYNHNNAINLAIQIQSNSFDFVKECERHARENLEKAKRKENKSKKQYIKVKPKI